MYENLISCLEYARLASVVVILSVRQTRAKDEMEIDTYFYFTFFPSHMRFV